MAQDLAQTSDLAGNLTGNPTGNPTDANSKNGVNVLNFPQNTATSTGLSYTLLPGQVTADFPDLELHNQAFEFWDQTWTHVFKEISGETLPREDFFRQNVIGTLCAQGQVIGLHLYTFFNLKSQAALHLPYFTKNYQPSALEALRSRGVQSTMSMEYLTLAKGYRNKDFSIPVAPVIGGLGFRVLLASGYDSMIAPCRVDLKVAERAKEFGAEAISEPFIHHGVPVVNMVTLRQNARPFPDPAVEAAVEKLWRERRDLSGYFTSTHTSKTQAA